MKAQKKYISDVVVLLTAGHGGMKADTYLTPDEDWKRVEFADGTVFYEGEFNRTLKSLLMYYLHQSGIKYIDIDPEQENIKRSIKGQRIDEAYKVYKNCIHLDLHANAFSIETANGTEFWTRVSQTPQITSLVKCLYQAYKNRTNLAPLNGYKLADRGIKTKDFDMLVNHNNNVPSVIVETAFYTNEKECKTYLIPLEGRAWWAKCLCDGILDYLKTNNLLKV